MARRNKITDLTPVSLETGDGPDTLVLKVSQDAYLGSAQYTVSVDGQQFGGTFTAHASHSTGQFDTLTLHGEWDDAGQHTVAVQFLNDAHGAKPNQDRNLYVDGASFNGEEIEGADLALLSSGEKSFHFSVDDPDPLPPDPDPLPDPDPTPGPDPTPTPGPGTNDPLHGVFVGNQPSELDRYEAWLGKPAEAVLAYTGDRDWNEMSPGWIMSQHPDHTLLFSIPLFPQTSSLQAVAGGAGDSHFRDIAQTILANAQNVDAPDGSIYVRTGWEMGGEWFPWGQQGNAHPELFRAAFQHFADAFHSVSDRFKIVWDVVGDRGDVEQFYPGDAYVDVVSQDFYWNPQWTSQDGGDAFGIIRDQHRGLQWIENFADAHGKPTAYSEWGVPAGYDATEFIQAAKAWFEDPAHDVKYATYWDSDAAYPGMISDGSDPATGAAYKDVFG
jgi:Ca-dependent carbohydrate-binding module xylan-binding/Glycosyl hydrolase family 26